LIISGLKLTYDEIRDAILNFDEKVLNVEKLSALNSILPTEDEKTLLKSFKVKHLFVLK
jgi:hypothetical protein